MLSNKSKRRFVASMLASILVVAACGSDETSSSGSSASTTGGPSSESTTGGSATATAADGEPQQGGILRVVQPSNVANLDPHIGVAGTEHYVLYTIFDRLIEFEPKTLTPEPGLATSWSYPDPMTLEMRLEEGVTFHDGTPFDAAAVKYNIERGLNHPDSSIKSDLASIDSVEVVDDYTVRVLLNRPDSALPLTFSDRAGMMVSPTAAEELGDEFTRNPVGTGPFVFESAVPNENVTVRRFDNYRKEGQPYLDGVDFSIITESRTAANALLSGQQDFLIQTDVADLDQFESSDDIETVISPSLALNRCSLALDRDPFSNLLVREAINYAIDRDAINQVVYGGLGEPAAALLPSAHWAYPADIPIYPYDPENAKELLAEAGYPDGITIETFVVASERDRKMVEVMQAQTSKAGVTLDVQVLDHAEALPAFRERGERDMYCVGWSGRPDPYQTYAALFSSDSAYANPYDEPAGLADLLAATIATDDQDARVGAFAELSQLAIAENHLNLNVVFRPGIQAFTSSVKGYTPNLYGKPIVNEIWLEE